MQNIVEVVYNYIVSPIFKASLIIRRSLNKTGSSRYINLNLLTDANPTKIIDVIEYPNHNLPLITYIREINIKTGITFKINKSGL